MYDNAKVSVIMPCFNANLTIKQSINSVLSQTYQNIELFIIDDASTVSCMEYIKEYVTDPRVHFIQLNKNSGPAGARNSGIEKSEGRYVAFLDSDDLWQKDKLELQLEYMLEEQSPFSFTAYQIVNEKGDKVLNTIHAPENITYWELLKNTIIGCSTVVIDRNQVGNFFMPTIRGGEDTATWLNILKKGHTALGIQETLTKYRILEGSLSRNKWKMLRRTWVMYRTTQHLSVLKTNYYFCFYVINAIKKRIKKCRFNFFLKENRFILKEKNKKIYHFVKRLLDIVLCLLGLIIIFPVLFVLSSAIWLEDRGPILFIQERTGLYGKIFKIYKFRSMKVNQVKKEYAFEHQDGVPDDFVFKNTQQQDASVTKIGKIIRKTSLDELPQLVNVIQGTMSIIGPRPEIPEIAKHYNQYQKKRLEIKPGVTGWAQVNGRCDMTNGEKVELDIAYIEKANLLFDIKILWKTIGVVFSSKGAV